MTPTGPGEDDHALGHAEHDHAHATGHGHGAHGHNHAAGANANALRFALALTATFLGVEVAGAFVFGSLALLSDAAHMLTDVVALAIALAAIKIGTRPPDDKRTFGYRRFEILAAAFNAVLLFAAAIYIVLESIRRFQNPEPVHPDGMFVVASLGLVVNLAAAKLLMAGKDTSLNIKGAYLEVWADMLGSIGVIVGATVIWFTGWTWIDPAIAVAIGFWVLPRTWTLLKDTTQILLEGVPRGLQLSELRTAIGVMPGVAGIHDLHVWSVSTDDMNASVHVELTGEVDAESVRLAVEDLFRNRFGIAHATIQTERHACRQKHGLHR